MGGSQRLPTMDERIRELENERMNNERFKNAILEGMKEIRAKISDIEKAKALTDEELNNLRVHAALIDKAVLNGSVASEVKTEVKQEKEVWIPNTEAISRLNVLYGLALPYSKGITAPLVSMGYLEEFKSGSSKTVRYRLTEKGKELGWMRCTSSGNLSMLESKLGDVKKTISMYYRDLYKE